MATKTTPGQLHRLDLRGHSMIMVEMRIVNLFMGRPGRLCLSCHFDEDPRDALTRLERHSKHWHFHRLSPGHWLIRNFAVTWAESVELLRSPEGMGVFAEH